MITNFLSPIYDTLLLPFVNRCNPFLLVSIPFSLCLFLYGSDKISPQGCILSIGQSELPSSTIETIASEAGMSALVSGFL